MTMLKKTAANKSGGIKHRLLSFREGYYGSRIEKTTSIWLWSAVLALICTFITYPGIWYSDSYVRVSTAQAVANSIVKTLLGQRMPLNTQNAFTIIPSFFMAISYLVTGQMGLYTFFQAFLFFASVFLLIRELNPAGKKWQYILFAVSPVIYGASVYYEANVGCLSGIIFLILLLRRVPDEKNRFNRILEFVLIAFFAFFAFGYRTNALSILPVLLVYLWKLKGPRVLKQLALLAICAGIALVWLIPWVFAIQGESNGMTGFVWEILTTIQEMDDDDDDADSDRKRYSTYLDEIGGEGATAAALASSTRDSVDGFMWGTGLNTETLSAPGASRIVIQKYFQLIVEKPVEFFRVKGEFLS